MLVGRSTMMQQIMRRIFADRPMPPPNTSKEEFTKMFDVAVDEFEKSGFLDSIKFEPVTSDEDLLDKLKQHKDELVVVKFWKHGCIPCLAFGEMFKAAEQQLKDEGKPVRFFGVDQKEVRDVPRYQLVEGTPTVLTFHQYKQVGDEIRATSLSAFTASIDERLGQLHGSQPPSTVL
jgi:thiol-disulfide isomerase/thioredoxin